MATMHSYQQSLSFCGSQETTEDGTLSLVDAEMEAARLRGLVEKLRGAVSDVEIEAEAAQFKC